MRAADDLGVGACVALVVLADNGTVLASDRVHTGPFTVEGAGSGVLEQSDGGSGIALGGGGGRGSEVALPSLKHSSGTLVGAAAAAAPTPAAAAPASPVPRRLREP